MDKRLVARTEHKHETGCVEWLGYLNRCGYGTLGVKGKVVLVHRHAWTEQVGPIPEGLCVLHRCDNPKCCNVEHLFLGSQLDNIKDRNIKGRTSSKRGETHPSAKLSDAEVAIIRACYVSSGSKYGIQRKLARVFGVVPEHISGIVRGVRRR